MKKINTIHSRAFVEDAVSIITESANDAIAQRGIFRLALSGGNSPRRIYAELAKQDLPWDSVQITFGDERCVQPEDAQSNYRMAKEALLDHVAISPANILRMHGELSPEAAAKEYEKALAALATRSGEARYIHDLLLLGLGPDGHTASLFPETTALAETQKSVFANFVPKLSAYRITFTYPLINAARHVCFLVEDAGKASVVEEILRGADYPAAHVRPENGQLTWLLAF